MELMSMFTAMWRLTLYEHTLGVLSGKLELLNVGEAFSLVTKTCSFPSRGISDPGQPRRRFLRRISKR